MRKYARVTVAVVVASTAFTVASAWPQGIRAQTPAVAPGCRALATSTATKRTTYDFPSEVREFSSELRSTCQFDRPTLEYRCTHAYSDSSGATSSTRLVTKYASIDDVLDEVKVVPPLRRALSSSGYRDDRPGNGSAGTAVIAITNNYDARGRLTSDTSPAESTVYSNWDQAGRPTVARTTGRGGAVVDRTMSYDNSMLRSRITTAGEVFSCTVFFDHRVIETSLSCVGPDAMSFLEITKVLETVQVCR